MIRDGEIYRNFKKILGLKKKKFYNTTNVRKKYNSFYNNKDRLRIAQLINDPYKIKYLYTKLIYGKTTKKHLIF